MTAKLEEVKKQVLCSLGHPEAEDGLYLRNFLRLHEEDTRPSISASPEEVLAALNELVVEGKVVFELGEKDTVVFRSKN